MGTLLGYAVDTLAEPVQAFRRMREQPAAYWGLFVFALVALAELSVTDFETLASLEGDLPGFQFSTQFMYTLTVASVVFGALAMLAYSGIVHGVARLLGGSGSFAGFFTAINFALLPGLLHVPIHLLARAVASPALAAIAQFAVGVWCLVLYVLAAREAYQVSTGKAIGILLLASIIPIAAIAVLIGLFVVLMSGLLASIEM